MIRGMYTAASGMITTLMANDTLANNLANVNTTGFKKNQISFQSFPEMLINKMTAGENQAIGGVMTGSKVYESRIHFDQGAIIQTGNEFDLALEGDGFFTLQDAAGETFYSRAGNFTVDQEGYLVNGNGYYLQGELGRIQLNLDTGPFKFDHRGSIIARERVVDQVKVTRFTDNRSLEKVGETLFKATNVSEFAPDTNPTQYPGYRMHQGKLERSNTNVIQELVNNIQGMRLYESLQRNIRMHNEATDKAVNEVGRPR